MNNEDTREVILFHLLKAIQHTRAGEDLTALRYDPHQESVLAFFGAQRYPGRVINVAMDSHWAMIKDVVNHLDIG